MAGFYPCLLGSSWLHKDEVSVCKAEGAGHKLSRMVMLTQQHSLHLAEREQQRKGTYIVSDRRKIVSVRQFVE